MAVGGEGAPLVPIYHAALARKIGKSGPHAFPNVGGVPNFTFIGSDEQIIALDNAPGNGMLDLTVQKRGLGRYDDGGRSEEHTSALQSLMRNSYAHFCLKTKNKNYPTP